MSSYDDACAFATNPIMQKQLAKYLGLRCFRNSVLEDLHAGTCTDSASGDYSDVSVSSPYGDIPWPKLSRFNDDEMKYLMIDDVNRTCCFIRELFNENTCEKLLVRLAERDPLPRWDEPTLLDNASSKPRTDS